MVDSLERIFPSARSSRARIRPRCRSNIVGLPGWAASERYQRERHVVTAQFRRRPIGPRVLRALLADRFKLAVHLENREQPVYDLVLAHRDGRLGPGLNPVDIDCAAKSPRTGLLRRRPSTAAHLPLLPVLDRLISTHRLRHARCARSAPCSRDRVGDRQGRLGDLMEGETTMDNLAATLRFPAGRSVVNKTGLSGSYRVAMNFRHDGGPAGATSQRVDGR